MLNLSQVFNPNDVAFAWISSTTNNFTGDLSLTLGFALLCLLVLMSIFKLPDLLIVVLLFAPIVLFSRLDISFNLFVGLGLLFFALVLWSLFPSK